MRDYRISPGRAAAFRLWSLPIFAGAIATSDGAASALEIDVAGAVECFLGGPGKRARREDGGLIGFVAVLVERKWVSGSVRLWLYGTAVARPDWPATIMDFQERFASEAACLDYLAASRWPDGFACPGCGGGRAWVLERRHLWGVRRLPPAEVGVLGFLVFVRGATRAGNWHHDGMKDVLGRRRPPAGPARQSRPGGRAAAQAAARVRHRDVRP